MKSLKNAWVLVTGAASGIGLACAKAYAVRGANIVMTDINEAALAAAAEPITMLGVQCRTLVCDVSSEASVNACAAAVHADVAALDVLVNNAGTYYLGGFLETPLDMWQRMHQVNVMGMVHCTRAFLPHMRAAAGPRRIVNIASLSSFLPAPNLAAYSMSKHAVLGASEVLAMELDRTNVSVLAVFPGIINTPLLGGKVVGANISARQLKTQQSYYQKNGCAPDVVGESVARATLGRQPYLWIGPNARTGFTITRVSRTLARRASIRAARLNGYLDAPI